ncbi:hypothetical protein [Arsenophonus nasoniae]|uniref:hypothetical protein n=1 Tax=Arsenophonus nasoniae TaxID=638 RepID=UPI00108480FB|nr:hypothetical protein [Arsenophonus nasoniae]
MRQANRQGNCQVLLGKVEPAIFEVVTHLVKERCEKAEVIEAAKTTAEAIVEGMTSIFPS